MVIPSLLTFAFPSARPGVDWKVRDDKDGKDPYIVQWDASAIGAPQPTLDDLTTIDASPDYQAWLLTQTPDALQATALANHPIVQYVVPLVLAEIQKAVPSYTPPDTATLTASVQASVAATLAAAQPGPLPPTPAPPTKL